MDRLANRACSRYYFFVNQIPSDESEKHLAWERTCAISRATCAARASSASCFCFSVSLSSLKPATAWVSLSHSFVGPTLPSLSKNTGKEESKVVRELVLCRGGGGCGEARPHRSPSHAGNPFSASLPPSFDEGVFELIPAPATTGLQPLRCRARDECGANSKGVLFSQFDLNFLNFPMRERGRFLFHDTGSINLLFIQHLLFRLLSHTLTWRR